MPDVAGFPYIEAEFTVDGTLNPPTQTAAILAFLRALPGQRDLLVLAHGWNNDMADARALYRMLLESMRGLLGAAAPGEPAVLGVLWPSKKFADAGLIPGGGIASADGDTTALAAKLDRLRAGLPADRARLLDEAKAALGELADRRAARTLFLDRLRRALERDPAREPDAADQFFGAEPEGLFASLETPILLAEPVVPGGGAGGVGAPDVQGGGGAAGLGDIATGILAAADRLVNYATYYQMKARAGIVGRGLGQLLDAIRGGCPDLRLHLCGHSFGARVVTAAAQAATMHARPASLTLLQAAFSHNGFSGGFDVAGQTVQGFFRDVISARKIDGPIVVTHTVNDKAVGIAYAIASRLARQNNADLGDADDIYGGLGRNGAIHTAESVAGTLLPPGQRYTLQSGAIHNLRADAFIADHGDVANPACANALLAAIGRQS